LDVKSAVDTNIDNGMMVDNTSHNNFENYIDVGDKNEIKNIINNDELDDQNIDNDSVKIEEKDDDDDDDDDDNDNDMNVDDDDNDDKNSSKNTSSIIVRDSRAR
jgi:hypothetical protein